MFWVKGTRFRADYNEEKVTKIIKIVDKYKHSPIPVRASFWFLICSFLQRGISMITTPIFTRLLTTAEYGQFGVFNSWYGIVSIVVSLSLYQGVHAQGIVKFSEERAVFSSTLQGLTLLLTSIWSIAYILTHQFWNGITGLTTSQTLSMLVMIWATASFSFWANEQRMDYKYHVLVTVTILVSLAKPLLGIFLVTHAEDKVTARILGLMIVELAAYSWTSFLLIKRGKKFFSKRFWRYAILFNVPLVPHYLSQTVLNSADRIMIKKMVGESEAGIYNLAYSVSSIMTLFNTALSQTVSPWIYKKIKDRKGKEIAPIAYITLLFVAAVNLVLIVLAPEAVAIFAPEEYYDAIWVIPPVAMSAFFMYSYDMFAKFAFYYEKTKMIMVASIFGAILNLFLNYIFIRQLGYVIAGYTTLVCYVVYAMTHYCFMKKVCDEFCDGEYPYEVKRILLITIPFMVIGFILLATYSYPFIRYGLIILFLLGAFIIRKRALGAIRDIINIKHK